MLMVTRSAVSMEVEPTARSHAPIWPHFPINTCLHSSQCGSPWFYAQGTLIPTPATSLKVFSPEMVLSSLPGSPHMSRPGQAPLPPWTCLDSPGPRCPAAWEAQHLEAALDRQRITQLWATRTGNKDKLLEWFIEISFFKCLDWLSQSYSLRRLGCSRWSQRKQEKGAGKWMEQKSTERWVIETPGARFAGTSVNRTKHLPGLPIEAGDGGIDPLAPCPMGWGLPLGAFTPCISGLQLLAGRERNPSGQTLRQEKGGQVCLCFERHEPGLPSGAPLWLTPQLSQSRGELRGNDSGHRNHVPQ